ncbi:HET-domain-containing protein [Nemania abortiva]|nr:HET-domain-containing protein [Nemania abortiva]
MAVGSSQEYVYTKLAKDRKYIRLLEIKSGPEEPTRISLQEVDLDSPPLYRCLSYTWGDPLDRSLPSLSNEKQMSSNRDHYVKNGKDGSDIRVSENLVDALQQIRRIQDAETEAPVSSWWIDAICIDQDDAEERSSQVSMMDKIYQRAVGVLVWLGKEDENTGVAIKVMKSLARVSPALTKTPRRDLEIQDVCPQDLFQYAAFLQRQWFTRMWVIQESFFSAATTVFCGKREIKWALIQESSRVVSQTGMDTLLKAYVGYTKEFSPDVGTVKLPDNRLSNQLIFGSLQKATGEALSLGRLLYYTRFFEASDPRDKVFAILGLWKSKRGDRAGKIDIRPDYNKDLLEVYIEATTAAIQESGNLDILSLVEGPRREATSRLPSWVPDYSQGAQLYPIVQPSAPSPYQLRLHANFKAPEDPKMRLLVVDGFEIDVVEEVGPTYSDIMNGDSELRSLLNMLLTYPQTHYPTGESPCDAFWRTLIKDTFRGSRAGVEARLAFPAFIMQRLRETRDQIGILEDFDERNLAEELSDILRETGTTVERLSSRYGEEKAIPTLDEIKEMVRIEKEEDSPEEQQLESDRKDIEESFRIAYFGRRLFRTAQGYFGIASQSIVPGDRAWLLAGARVPFVLKTADEDGERWQLVSEAYVHGVMRGESSADERSVRRICLV